MNDIETVVPSETEVNSSETAKQEAQQASADQQGVLFPVDFTIENLNFAESVFDEIELKSQDAQGLQIQIDQEDLASLENIPKKMAFKLGQKPS